MPETMYALLAAGIVLFGIYVLRKFKKLIESAPPDLLKEDSLQNIENKIKETNQKIESMTSNLENNIKLSEDVLLKTKTETEELKKEIEKKEAKLEETKKQISSSPTEPLKTPEEASAWVNNFLNRKDSKK